MKWRAVKIGSLGKKIKNKQNKDKNTYLKWTNCE